MYIYTHKITRLRESEIRSSMQWSCRLPAHARVTHANIHGEDGGLRLSALVS